jgi:hypothetical protein
MVPNNITLGLNICNTGSGRAWATPQSVIAHIHNGSSNTVRQLFERLMTWYTLLPTSTRNARAIHLLHQVYFTVMMTDPIILKHQSPHRMFTICCISSSFY